MAYPAPNTDAVLAALRACTDPLGATFAGLRETAGLTVPQLGYVVITLKKRGLAFPYRRLRLFLSAEARDAAAPMIDEMTAVGQRKAKREAKAKRRKAGAKRVESPRATKARRERERVRAEAKTDARRAAKGLPPLDRSAPKVAKPKYVPKPKPHQGVQFNQPKARPAPEKLKAFKEQDAIKPPHVVIQKIPGAERGGWNVSIPVGGFVSEWRTKRGQAA